MSEYRLLSGRIQEYLVELERVVERAVRFGNNAHLTGEEAYWDAVALNLHSYYSGIERIFEDIARTIDRTIPESSDWHQRLLFQMTAEIPGIRPAVIGRDTRLGLDDYRAFRHVVRHVYAFNFRPNRLHELVQGLPGGFGAVQNDLAAFREFLEELDQPGIG
jgi:hypothetical protein